MHGYTSQRGSAAGRLGYTPAGEVVYAAACYGVVLTPAHGKSPQERRQRVLGEHSDAITALASHPGGRFVATGQLGLAPRLLVWDASRTPVQVRVEPVQP